MPAREIYGLIGPNGAGKTTIFNLLTGVYEPTAGEIYFQGKRIDGLRSYEIARRGVSRTFQNIRLFPSMSVLENVMTACHIHAKQSLADAVLRTPRFERDERDHREFCLELLEIFDLARYRNEGGTSLPYGNQRRLEIVRALATRPKLAAGRPARHEPAGEDLMAFFSNSRPLPTPILLVEHNIKFHGVCSAPGCRYGKSIALGSRREELPECLSLLRITPFSLSFLFLCADRLILPNTFRNLSNKNQKRTKIFYAYFRKCLCQLRRD